MMSAEWLASGTDPVRLPAKGVEDTGRETAAERTRKRAGARSSRSKMMISVKILLPRDDQGFPCLVHERGASHSDCAASLPRSCSRPMGDC